jgi:2-dehydro-3-deoxy-D-arabinonate dehydratase
MRLIRFRNASGGTPLVGTLDDAAAVGTPGKGPTAAGAGGVAPGTADVAPGDGSAPQERISPLAEAPAIADVLALPLSRIREILDKPGGEPVPVAGAELLAPIDGRTEVWAAGVTYERSRAARVIESEEAKDVYDLVYTAERPEIFFKSAAWRVRGPGSAVSVRSDSGIDVPEPELAAVLNSVGEVVGYTICNDMSSRSIEGQNPLYLPQAKIYLGGCAIGPWIRPAWEVPDPYALTIEMAISRDGAVVWEGESSTSGLRRRVEELAEYLFREEEFPAGAVLSTGTSLVPDLPFTLQPGDEIRIRIAEIGELVNPVVRGKAALTGG